MVLSPGGPAVRGAWYFTTAAIEHRRNRWGSLNYWKGTGAPFVSVGEVTKYQWRDGSVLPCNSLPPVPVCFHTGRPGYTGVKVSVNGGTPAAMTFIGNPDNWAKVGILVNGVNTAILTACGPSGHTGKQTCSIDRAGDSIIWRDADAWDGATVWTYNFPASYRDAWPPTVITLTVAP